MIRFLLSCILVFPHFLLAQFSYVIDQTIPVQDMSGTPLAAPWAGGLNAVQYNTFDLNQDGKDDLVLYDRMADRVITFVNQDNQYHYAPHYEALFPEAITNFLLLRDFNCDGKKDIFTGDVLGIKVFQNVTSSGQNLAWTQFYFYSGFPGSKSPVLLSKGFSSKINLQLQFDDLPAITDADGDGDLDIFSMRFVGNGTVELHKNFSKERYGTCDSLDFERITQAWGDFKECSCGRFAFNTADCPAGGRVEHAGGKSLLAFDLNGDQQQDLVFSEATCNQLYQFRNEGTLLAPVIQNASQFPESRPVSFPIFPAAYWEDVDFDGKKDLLATPNIFSKDFLSTNLKQSNWFYKNTGTNEAPVFSFVEPDFLQKSMIDIGDNAIPAFADLDGDGDLDMFVSKNFNTNSNGSSISLYQNTGTQKAPEFELLTEDYLGFSLSEFYNLKIQFTDISQDNTSDLVFTATSLFTGTTNLYAFINNSPNALDFSGAVLGKINFSLNYNENLYLTDYDSDGKPDILAGRGNGALQYWRNTGSGSSNAFTLTSDSFLGLGSSILRQNISCAVADLDADGREDLVYSDQTGKLKIISDYKNAASTEPVSEIIFNELTGTYTDQNLGGRTWPTVANLFGTTKPALVVGNILGGLHVLRNQEEEPLSETAQIDIYPNPVLNLDGLNIKIDRPAVMQIVSVLGQQLTSPVRLQAHQIYQHNTSSLSAGLYLVVFKTDGKTFTRRLVIQ